MVYENCTIKIEHLFCVTSADTIKLVTDKVDKSVLDEYGVQQNPLNESE